MTPYGLGNPLSHLESAVPAVSPSKVFCAPSPLAGLGYVRSRKGLSKPCSEVMKTCLSYQHCFQHKAAPSTSAYEENSLYPRLTSTYGRIPIPLHSWLQNTFAVFDNLFILTFSSLCFWFLHSDIRHTKKANSFPHTPSKFFRHRLATIFRNLAAKYKKKNKLAMYTVHHGITCSISAEPPVIQTPVWAARHLLLLPLCVARQRKMA